MGLDNANTEQWIAELTQRDKAKDMAELARILRSRQPVADLGPQGGSSSSLSTRNQGEGGLGYASGIPWRR